MHRQLRRNFAGAFAIEFFSSLSYSPVQVDTPRWRDVFVQDVPIQCVYEAVATDRFSVREYLNAAILDELAAPRQFLASTFDSGQLLRQSGRHRQRGKLCAGYAGCLENAPLFRFE